MANFEKNGIFGLFVLQITTAFLGHIDAAFLGHFDGKCGSCTKVGNFKTTSISFYFHLDHLYVHFLLSAILMGHSQPLFLSFRFLYKQLAENNCSIKVADDRIRTQVLGYCKRPRCRLC